MVLVAFTEANKNLCKWKATYKLQQEVQMSSKWMSGLIIGGVIGASVAFLTASRSGEKTRAMISEKGMVLKDKAMEKVNQARGMVDDVKNTVIDNTMERVDRLKDVGRNVLEAESVILEKSKKDAKKAIAS